MQQVKKITKKTHWGHVFFLKFSADQLLAFKWSQAQVFVFYSYSCPLKLSINLWITLQLFELHCMKLK